MLTEKKLTNEELLKYENITKDYPPLKLKPETSKKMKFRYNNPDDEDKHIIVESNDEIIEVRSKEVIIEQKNGKFIKLTFHAPKTLANYKPIVVIRNKRNGEIEEILRFNIYIES